MYKPKLEKDIRCPLEYGLEIFGGKWKSRIICVLSKKKILRYSEFKKKIGKHNRCGFISIFKITNRR